MTMQPIDQPVSQQYARPDLGAAILNAARAAGINHDGLKPRDLAPVDQFHSGGWAATLELANMSGLQAGVQVLDVGGGIGGAARCLASEFGCRVEVLDITEDYCRAGELLTAAAGLRDRVTFRYGSALDMPYADGSYDVVWTQHSSMNIADKERLYREIFRVMRPGGKLALHEIMAGSVTPLHFPLPWARDPAISALQPPEAIRSLLKSLGFAEIAWVDVTDKAIQWFEQRLAAAPATPPLGLHLLMGPDIGPMLRNLLVNLQEDRVRAIEAVFGRP